MRSRLLVAIAFLMSGVLSARAETPTGEDSSTFRLEVRVHLLTSQDVRELNCTLSDDEIRELFAGANDVWKQAGIVWEVESIVREPAAQEMHGRFATLIHKSKEVPRKLDISEMRDVVRKIYSTDNQLAGGWNLYVVEDLGTPRDVFQKVQTLFEGNDTNADGAVTRDEARPIFLNNFATYDANEDGRVELLEFQNAFDRTVRPSRPQNAAAEPAMPEYQQAGRALGQRILGVRLNRKPQRNPWFHPRCSRSDQNSDGVSDQDEFESLLLRVRVGRSQTQRRATGSVFEQYDQDSDGKLSRDEVGDSWERVAPFDNNQDETIDQQEFSKAQSNTLHWFDGLLGKQ